MMRQAWVGALVLGCVATAAAQEPRVDEGVRIPDTGRIEGRVIDADGAPVPAAIVTFAGTQQGTIAEADGTFQLVDVPAGTHHLAASAAEVGERLVDVAVTAGGVTRVEIVLLASATPGEQIVVVGTRLPEKRLDAPVTIEIVTERDLATASGPSYLSALSRVKGVDYSDAGIGDQRISARGFATQFNSRMLTMIDGRLAMLPGNGLPQGTMLPATGLDLKSVEVVVGPASALYGPNAHTGVVNVVTKTPWDESGAALTVRGGTREMLGGAARVAGVVRDTFGWKLNGELLRAEDFATDPATHTFGTSIAESALVDDYRVTSGKLDGTAYYRRAGWLASAGAGFSDFTGFSITNAGRNHLRGWRVATQTAQLSGEHVHAQVTRTASDAGRSYQLDRLARTVEAMGTTDPAAIDAIRDDLAFVDDSSLVDGELQLRHPFGPVRATAGGQVRRYAPSSAGTYLDDADRAIRITELGAYVQLDANVLGERLRLAAAARADRHDEHGTQLSPKAAVQLEVARGHNVRVGYNRAFKSPTILESYLRIADVLLGNRDGYVIRDAAGAEVATIAPLVPEQVDAVELGYKGAIGATLYVDAVAYHSWYRDFISPLTRVADPAAAMPTFAYHADGTPVAEGTPAEGTLSTYMNFGRAQVRGVDVGVDWQPRAALAFTASGSLLQLASFDNDSALQNELRLNAPAVKLRGSAQVSGVLVDGASLRVDGRYHSGFPFESGYWNSDGLLGGDVPGRVVVDVTAGYELASRGVTFSATVANVLDDRTPDVLGAPIPRRWAWLQVGYRHAGLD